MPKLSSYPAVSGLNLADRFAIIQGGANKTASLAQVVAAVGGLPSGGTAKQFLIKLSGADYASQWTTLSAPDVAGTFVPVTGSRNMAATDNNGMLSFTAGVNFGVPTGLGAIGFTGAMPSTGSVTFTPAAGVTINDGTVPIVISTPGLFSLVAKTSNNYVLQTPGVAPSGGVPTSRTVRTNGLTRDLSSDCVFPGGVRPVGHITADATKTDANATEATLATIPLPAGWLEAGDDLIVHCRGTYAATTAVPKIFQVKLGGVSFFISSDTNTASLGGFEFTARLFARSLSAQIGTQGYVWGAGGTNGNPGPNLMRDLTAAQDITVTGQFASAGSGSQAITLRVAYADIRKGS